MVQPHLEITYRHGKALAAYLRLPRARGAQVAHTREMRLSILADVDSAGQLLGLEFLAPDSTTIAEVQSVLAEFQTSPVADEDLRPLRAA